MQILLIAQEMEYLQLGNVSLDGSKIHADASKSKGVSYKRLLAIEAFLQVFLLVATVYALVRLRSNRVLYEEPEPRKPKAKGRTRKHGRKFKLSAPWRCPDQTEMATLLGQQIRLQAWHGLHFYRLPALVGLVLCIEFLKAAPRGYP
ncbi:MAG: hypothetical protein GY759_16820, partial [Chloroflexi bacterium]|nr:hypothetical protein [Chloroflexota bacterium]